MTANKEQLYIEKIKALEELVDLYSKDYRKQGLKYPDDYNTTQGRKVIKLRDKIASLTEQINQTEPDKRIGAEEWFDKNFQSQQAEQIVTDKEIEKDLMEIFNNNSSDANNGQMSVITEDSYSDTIDEIIEWLRSKMEKK